MIQALIDDLVAARAALLDAVERAGPALTAPGPAGAWGARELVAHLGYWAGHAVETIHAVEEGRAGEVGAGLPPTDEVNDTVARVAREADLATVRKREAASVEALLERLRRMDPGLLAVLLPDGLTLEASIREDGPDHYREHAEDLQRAPEAHDGARGD